jgi:mono/diheme cytochrome c family protein
VPRQSDCLGCHEGRSSRVLGFNALQLSSDRDPNAPHREAVPHDALDLDELIARDLLHGLPANALRTPPKIYARSARERAALGYLYGNCSGCHNAESSIASLGLDLDQTFARNETLRSLTTTVSVPSGFTIPNREGTTLRIAPGQAEASALAYRMSTRFPAAQMPPLGTRLVDDEALALVRAWISEDLVEVAEERERQ